MDDLETVPGDEEKYSDFKGQLLQLFSPHLVLLFEAKFKSLAQFISTKCKQSVENCPVIGDSKFFRDKIEIMDIVSRDLSSVMALGPGKPLIRAMELLAFTPESGDTRPRGALHEYADALLHRMPGALTESKHDDIVNDTVFVVYNTAAKMCSDLQQIGNEVSDRVMEQYAECDEITTYVLSPPPHLLTLASLKQSKTEHRYGIQSKFSEVSSKARDRIVDMILADVMSFMKNKQFVETFSMKSYDEELAKYHIAPLENRVTRHVAAVKETLQHSTKHFLSFCTWCVRAVVLLSRLIPTLNRYRPLRETSGTLHKVSCH